MSNAFDRLDPALQFQIVHGLGFTGLRPVQELAADAILDGDNAVVLAPTAGGKTEASFLPLLSLASQESWAPACILYLTPIKALLNNQEARLNKLASLVGRRAFKWHGDVNDSQRKRFRADPADILLTTPEALEGMFISRKTDHVEVFTNLRAVVIDEVHAFAGDDRGAQLSCLLERLSRVCGRDLQRVGLSATVGNPDEILSWIAGGSKRPGRMVDPPKQGTQPKVELDFVGSIANAALVIQKLHPGKKRLVFCDSRRKVEEIGRELDELGLRSFVMHSSLSTAERSLAEREFEEGSDCVIVATSAMELGIDVGDLDHVLQIDSPPSVASFLQRMGRTGRRADTVPNCTFLATRKDDALQAAALLRLWQAGFVESVRPVWFGPHIAAQQLMSLLLQEGASNLEELRSWLGHGAPLQEMSEEDWSDLVQHMLDETFLIKTDGLLSFGPMAEKRFGKRNFLDLLAVFEGSVDFKAFHGTREIGNISSLWVSQKGRAGEGFVLGGRVWEVQSVDYSRKKVFVSPGEHGKAVGWMSAPRGMGFEHCQAMFEILRGDEADATWSPRAASVMEELRDEFADVPGNGLQRVGTRYVWHTYAGLAVNAVLQAWLERVACSSIKADNLTLDWPKSASQSDSESMDLSDVDVGRASQRLPVELIGKFRWCLTESMRDRVMSARNLDPVGAEPFVSTLRKVGLS